MKKLNQTPKKQKLRIQPVHRTVLQDQLLTALDNKNKVACLFTEEDLEIIITTFQLTRNRTAEQELMLTDLETLRKAAFNV